jgi:hypothetical protein
VWELVQIWGTPWLSDVDVLTELVGE